MHGAHRKVCAATMQLKWLRVSAVELCMGRLRHRRLLEEREVELAAEELRCAARSLGRLTGAIDTEEVLDSIFAEFCIGK